MFPLDPELLYNYLGEGAKADLQNKQLPSQDSTLGIFYFKNISRYVYK